MVFPTRVRADVARHDVSLGTLCLWGVRGLHSCGISSTRTAWGLLARQIPQRTVAKIAKLVVVNQRDGTQRVDLFVPTARLLKVLSSLRLRGHASWYARPHRSFADRHAAPASQSSRQSLPTTPRASSASPELLVPISVLSYNINGLRRKRDLFRHSVEELGRKNLGFGPDLIALQETRVKDGHWAFRMSGYRQVETHEDPSVPGSRGLSLLVRADHSFQVLDTTPWSQVVRASLSNCLQTVVVVNLYLPHDAAARQTALARLASHVWPSVSPSEPVIVVGDFNCAATHAFDRLAESGLPIPLRFVRSRHGRALPVTRWGVDSDGSATQSAIDHCFCSQQFADESFVSVLPAVVGP